MNVEAATGEQAKKERTKDLSEGITHQKIEAPLEQIPHNRVEFERLVHRQAEFDGKDLGRGRNKGTAPSAGGIGIGEEFDMVSGGNERRQTRYGDGGGARIEDVHFFRFFSYCLSRRSRFISDR